MTKFLAESGLKRVWAKFKAYTATTSRDGLMSKSDKKKLNSVGTLVKTETSTNGFVSMEVDSGLYYVVLNYNYEDESEGAIYTQDTAIVDTVNCGGVFNASIFNIYAISDPISDIRTINIDPPYDESTGSAKEIEVSASVYQICAF